MRASVGPHRPEILTGLETDINDASTARPNRDCSWPTAAIGSRRPRPAAWTPSRPSSGKDSSPPGPLLVEQRV